MVWKSASLKIAVITRTSRLTRNIRSSWSWMSFIPGKAATPWIISMKMQPTPLEGTRHIIKSSFSNAAIRALRDIPSSRIARIKNGNEIRPPQKLKMNPFEGPEWLAAVREPIQKVIEDISQMKTFMRKGFNNLQDYATTRRFALRAQQNQNQDQDRLPASPQRLPLWHGVMTDITRLSPCDVKWQTAKSAQCIPSERIWLWDSFGKEPQRSFLIIL